MESFFSFNGRVRRMTFWINGLLMLVLSAAVSLTFVKTTMNYPFDESYVITNKPVYYVLAAIILLRNASVFVRRFHDQDKGAEWAVAALAYPVLSAFMPNLTYYTTFGTILTIVGSLAILISLGFLGFVPGDEGENSFGPPPPEGQML